MAILLTEDDQIKLREYLKVLLSVGVNEVVFTKKDGSIRVLKGTRDPAIIGQALFEAWANPPPRKDGKPRVESTTSLPTFDTEANAWRSFSFAELIGVNGININELLINAQILDGV